MSSFNIKKILFSAYATRAPPCFSTLVCDVTRLVGSAKLHRYNSRDHDRWRLRRHKTEENKKGDTIVLLLAVHLSFFNVKNQGQNSPFHESQLKWRSVSYCSAWLVALKESSDRHRVQLLLTVSPSPVLSPL